MTDINSKRHGNSDMEYNDRVYDQNDAASSLRTAYLDLMAERDRLAIRNAEFKTISAEKQKIIEGLKNSLKRASRQAAQPDKTSIGVQEAVRYNQEAIQSSARWRLGNFLINLVQVPAQALNRLMKSKP